MTIDAGLRLRLVGVLIWTGILSASARATCVPEQPILKLNARYSGPGVTPQNYDFPYGVFAESNGDIVVAGTEMRSDLSPNEQYNWLVRKYHGDGTLVWSRSYASGPNLVDIAYCVTEDRSGHLFVAGFSYEPFSSSTGAILEVKSYDREGALLWSRSHANPGSWAKAYGICVDLDGNIAVAGVQPNPGLGYDWVIIKYSPGGTVLWEKSYDNPAHTDDWAISITSDSSGNIIVAGYSLRTDLGQSYDWTIRKYTPGGMLLWERTYNGPVNNFSDQVFSVVVDGSDSVIVGGDSDSLATVRKYDQSGALVWSRTYTVLPYIYFTGVRSMALDQCGNILVAGQGMAPSPQWDDWIVLKYTSDGDLLWSTVYDSGRSGDMNTGAAIDGAGNSIFVGTQAAPVGGDNDWIIRTYTSTNCDCPGMLPPAPRTAAILTSEPIESGRVKIVGGVRGYLDPKRGEEATILVRPTDGGEIRVRIYDMAGALVKEMVRTTTGGHTEVMGWNSTDTSGNPVPAGVYPILIEAPGIKYKDKLVVVR